MMTSLRILFATTCLLFCLLISACTGQGYMPRNKAIAANSGTGAMIGALLSTAVETSTPIGMVAGAATGATLGTIAQSNAGVTYRIVNSGIPVIHYGDHTIVVLPSDRIFDIDSPELRPESTQLLVLISTLVKANPRSVVTIAGYTDDVGSYEHNLNLSHNQALRVLNFMWTHGVDFKRMKATGYGYKPDVASNMTSLGSHFNRRVEIRIHPEHKYT